MNRGTWQHIFQAPRNAATRVTCHVAEPQAAPSRGLFCEERQTGGPNGPGVRRGRGQPSTDLLAGTFPGPRSGPSRRGLLPPAVLQPSGVIAPRQPRPGTSY